MWVTFEMFLAYLKQSSVKSDFRHPPGTEQLLSLVHSAIRCIALEAAARRVLLGNGSTGQSTLGTDGVRFSWGWAEISRWYSLAIGRLVVPPWVRIFTARTWPSLPGNSSCTTASFQLIREPSSCTNTTSPTLTAALNLLPVVLWNSLSDVRYSCLQRAQKCYRRRARRFDFFWISAFPFWL